MATTTASVSDREMQGSERVERAGAPDNAPAPAPNAQARETLPERQPGRPRKRALSPHSSSSWHTSDSQPPPKRGRGRPRTHPLRGTFESRARHRRAGSAGKDMPARNAARPTATPRRSRTLPDPYTVLRLKRCETDAALIRAAYATAMMSCSDILPGPLQLSDEPDSTGHQRLMLVSDAHMILEDRRLKMLLDKCLNHHYLKYTGSAVDILDIALGPGHSPPTEEEVERAYNDRMAEWSGFEKVAEVVIRTLKAARETVLRDLKEAREEQEEPDKGTCQVRRRDSVVSDATGLEGDD